MNAGLIFLEVSGHHRELFMPAWVFGLVAFAILMLGLIALWSYSNRRPHS
ncbi:MULTISPECIES: hypothetical protein [Desertihabitans]|nr:MULTISPECIES: hypothetical protein [Desertihabitans]